MATYSKICEHCSGNGTVQYHEKNGQLKRGTGPEQKDLGCGKCCGTGEELTDEGKELLDFIDKHINKHGKCVSCDGKGKAQVRGTLGRVWEEVPCPECYIFTQYH